MKRFSFMVNSRIKYIIDAKVEKANMQELLQDYIKSKSLNETVKKLIIGI
jgi:hypothetical protein